MTWGNGKSDEMNLELDLEPPLQWIVDDDGMPHPVPGGLKWARWMHEQGQPGGLRVVGRDVWEDESLLSTIFIGVDMGFGMGPDFGTFWETMYFPHGGSGDMQQRYTSQREALAGHEHLLKEILAEMGEMGETVKLVSSERWVPPELRLLS